MFTQSLLSDEFKTPQYIAPAPNLTLISWTPAHSFVSVPTELLRLSHYEGHMHDFMLLTPDDGNAMVTSYQGHSRTVCTSAIKVTKRNVKILTFLTTEIEASNVFTFRPWPI
jgi:hypothetical protein